MVPFYRGKHLNALISAARVAPIFPALLHGGVVVALVVVTRRGVGVSADRHAVALVLFKLLVHLAFSVVYRWVLQRCRYAGTRAQKKVSNRRSIHIKAREREAERRRDDKRTRERGNEGDTCRITNSSSCVSRVPFNTSELCLLCSAMNGNGPCLAAHAKPSRAGSLAGFKPKMTGSCACFCASHRMIWRYVRSKDGWVASDKNTQPSVGSLTEMDNSFAAHVYM